MQNMMHNVTCSQNKGMTYIEWPHIEKKPTRFQLQEYRVIKNLQNSYKIYLVLYIVTAS